MISVAQAHESIQAHLNPPQPGESVSFQAAAGRVLAQDIRATMPQPRFTNSAMDGFAVRSADTATASNEQAVPLRVTGVVSAGDGGELAIKPGECAQVMTGAALPQGADAVVKVEDTAGFGADTIHIESPIDVGHFVRQRGEEVMQGQLLVPAGTRVTAGEIGMLATYGYAQVEVAPRPTVALLVTGNELVEPGVPLAQGQVYNSNLHVLARLAAQVGAEVVHTRTIGDDPAALQVFLNEALEACQVVVTSAGVSMGQADHVRAALAAVGMQEIFWKVAQKPGMPLLFGRKGQNLVFGLPGNPVSAFICFMEYVWPVLEALQGLAPAPKLAATLDQPFIVEPKKHRFMFGAAWLDGARLKAAPSHKLGSHMLSSAVGANCILEAPPGPGPLPPGDSATLNLLPWAQPLSSRP